MGIAINSQADNKELVLRIENCLDPLVYCSAFLLGLALSCLFLAPALKSSNTREQQFPLKVSWLHGGAVTVSFCSVPTLKIKTEKRRGEKRGGRVVLCGLGGGLVGKRS